MRKKKEEIKEEPSQWGSSNKLYVALRPQIRSSLGLQPMARTSLPFLLMYFAKQEEGNMTGARHRPDSNAHGHIPFMPAHWRHRDNSAVGVGGCTVQDPELETL